MPSVYDDEREKLDGLDTGVGIGPAQEQANDGRQSAYERELQGIESGYDKTADEPRLPNDQLGRGYREDDGGSGLRSLIGGMSGRKKKAIGGGILGGGLVTAVLALLGITSGPLQMIHYGELMSQFFMSRNDESTNNRTSKFLIYAFAGKAQQGRLTVKGNIIADRAEKRLQERSGLKSLYNRAGRLTGYEILDPTKAQSVTSELRQMGIEPTDGPNGTRVLDLRTDDSNYSNRRAVTRLIVKSAGYNKIASTVSSRLLIKRGGVNFHPLKKSIRNLVDGRAESREEQKEREREAQAEAKGDVSGGSNDAGLKDQKGKIAAKLAAGGAVLGAIGTICAVNDFSGSIDAQDVANREQQLREGMFIQTAASQFKSGQDLTELNADVASENLYDETTKTSFLQAGELQAEMGKPVTGSLLPDGLRPGASAENKPDLFKVVDALPIGTVCMAFNQAASLVPFQGQVAAALKSIGLDTQKYYDKAVAYFTTEVGTVKGAALGSVAANGMKLAANEQALALGGSKLTASESEELKLAARETRLAETSLYDRYFNIGYPDSLATSIAISLPANSRHAADTVRNLPQTASKSFALIFGSFFTKANAATRQDVYSFSDYGFSQGELDDPAYADPYGNGAKAETLLNIPCVINGKPNHPCGEDYSQDIVSCLGSKPVKDGQGMWNIQSNNGDTLDYKKVDSYSNNLSGLSGCDSDSGTWKILRFFVMDMGTINAAACYEGDQEACGSVGATNNSAATEASAPTGPGSLPDGAVSQLAQGLLTSPNVKISNANARKQIENVASTGSGEIDPVLIRVLSALSQNHTYTLSSLKRCTPGLGAGTASRHCVGKAADISGRAGVDGVTFDYTGHNATVQKFITDAASFLPGNCEVGVPNSNYVNATRPSVKEGCETFVDEGSAPHIHLSVP